MTKAGAPCSGTRRSRACADEGAKALLKAAGVTADEGVVDAADPKAFITAAKTRQWAREPKVRTLP